MVFCPVNSWYNCYLGLGILIEGHTRWDPDGRRRCSQCRAAKAHICWGSRLAFAACDTHVAGEDRTDLRAQAL